METREWGRQYHFGGPGKPCSRSRSAHWRRPYRSGFAGFNPRQNSGERCSGQAKRRRKSVDHPHRRWLDSLEKELNAAPSFVFSPDRMRVLAMVITRTILTVTAVASLLALANAQHPSRTAKAQPVLDVTSMDRSIDPCVDFYTYSCGGWMKNNPIPPDQSSWSAYGKLQDENFGRLREILGDKPERSATEAETVMRMETALAKGSMTRVERRDPQKLYHKMTLEEFEALVPSFQWKTYFTEVGLPALPSLNVATPEFFKVMNAEIEKEDLSSWKTYLRWHLIHANARHLSSAFVNADFDFYEKTLQGVQEIEPRWKRCTEDVDGDLGEALGQAYVEKYFSPEAKRQALRMVKEIESAMEADINTLPWMSAGTKALALVKLHAVANKVGYPDQWRDYSKLEIIRGDKLGNVLRARQFEFNRQLAKIGKPVDRGEWDMTPPTVNAYYNDQMNDINFPAGVLQPPLFDPGSDAAPNYGNTGGTIGHELTHGFDDEGRQYDAQGNLRQWWTPDDEKEFIKRATCISDQYSGYTIIDDIKINGKLTLGEDVADLGGLILAYMAWEEDTKGQNLQPVDALTPEQRFFVGYGQSWCANERDENKRLRATLDPHSPEQYRANGVVSNMLEFQQAFHCKVRSPMVHQNRCRVW